jgi:putative ABC transport system substrate-binding protein
MTDRPKTDILRSGALVRGCRMRFQPTTRRDFVMLLGGTSVWPLTARAQKSGQFRRIGMLETVPLELNGPNFDAFRGSLQELGYVEGKNLAIEYRSAGGRAERFTELAVDLLHLNVDVIVTRGTPAVLAAKKATTTTPIVMAAMGEPLMVISNLARPGGNITGLSGFSTDLEAKRAEVIKELVPKTLRIAGLYNMGNPVVPPQWEQLQTAAGKLGIEPLLLDIRRLEDIAPAFVSARSQHADALMVGVDALTQQYRALIAKLAADQRFPTIYVSKEYIEAGGLIAYGPSYPDLYRRAAIYVDKIFRGDSPSELPVEQPTKYELIINLNAAKALGLTVPPTLLARADEVIE